MFSRIAGVLAMHGLDVLAAVAFSTDDGRALDEFRVMDPLRDEPPWGRVIADVALALEGHLAIHARVTDRARMYARSGPRSRHPVVPSVTFDNRASDDATVIDVHAADAIGTLYRITRTLAEFDLDIRSAKVQTLGSEVVDAFYVRDRSGDKIAEQARLAEIERAILHAIGE
jgi:[protein-PII] uridylyltransferase